MVVGFLFFWFGGEGKVQLSLLDLFFWLVWCGESEFHPLEVSIQLRFLDLSWFRGWVNPYLTHKCSTFRGSEDSPGYVKVYGRHLYR